jgi:TolB protein
MKRRTITSKAGRRGAAALLLAAPLVCMSAAGDAHATYPGNDGRIAFGIRDASGNVDIYTVQPNGDGLRQLTTGPNFDACPAYSPDGRTIAYCSGSSDGVFEIWVMRQNGQNQHQVTHLGRFAVFPDFSPDGSQIVFEANDSSSAPGSSDADHIYVIRSDGSKLRQLTFGNATDGLAAWSPDGRKIVFLSDRTGVSQVYLMNPDGSDVQQLTDDSLVKDEVPDWSPDGAQIAYVVETPAGDRIFVMNADGTDQHQVSDGGGVGADWGVTWSPDGTQLAFLRELPNAPRTVYVSNADGSDAHPLYSAGTEYVPAWQPHSHHLHD